MAATKVVRSVRKDGKGFDVLVSEEGPEEIYADGFAGFAIAGTMAKLGLYLALEPTGGDADESMIDQRLLVARLTMPLDNFVEMCLTTLQIVGANREALRSAIYGRFDEMLASADQVLKTRSDGE